jgi:hypothetical protein
MEKFYNAICWIALGFLAVFGIPIFLLRYVVAPVWSFVWLFRHSPLPWWERALAAIAIIAGMAYLIRRFPRFSRRIPPNQNFAYYTSKPQEKRSPNSAKTEGL